MEPISMNSQMWRFWCSARMIAAGASLLWLAGCSLNSNSPNASLTPQDSFNYDPEAIAAEFDFPQTSCGEESSQPSGTWYVVYIDKANPDEVRRQYCRDAIGTTRRGSGVPTVQVASFTDYSKAMRFASAVGGEVEATTGQNAAVPSPSPTAAASPSNSTASETAYLLAQESGGVINIRESATQSSPIRQTARSGEQVRIVEEANGDDGYIWYKVAAAGQEGWVRGDLVSRESTGTAPGATVSSTATSTATSGASTTGSGSTTNPQDRSTAAAPNSSSASTNSYSIGNRSVDRYSSSSTWSANSSSNGRYQPPSPDENYADSATDTSSGDLSTDLGDSATLIADDPNSRINIRTDATTSAPIQYVGFAGDPVYIGDTAQGEDGYTWYYVEFDSGAVGWVRGDFVEGE
ncbi:MAG: hypothetical protein Kow00121_39580 [Elainellaceae cyanobacterium]